MIKIKQILTKEVITLPPDARLSEALEMMGANDMRHIPITLEGELLGIVSISDLLANSEYADGCLYFNDQAELADVMSREPITCDLNTNVASAAATMLSCKINCLPVLDRGIIVGIVTSSDLLETICARSEERGDRATPLNQEVRGYTSKPAVNLSTGQVTPPRVQTGAA